MVLLRPVLRQHLGWRQRGPRAAAVEQDLHAPGAARDHGGRLPLVLSEVEGGPARLRSGRHDSGATRRVPMQPNSLVRDKDSGRSATQIIQQRNKSEGTCTAYGSAPNMPAQFPIQGASSGWDDALERGPALGTSHARSLLYVPFYTPTCHHFPTPSPPPPSIAASTHTRATDCPRRAPEYSCGAGVLCPLDNARWTTTWWQQ